MDRSPVRGPRTHGLAGPSAGPKRYLPGKAGRLPRRDCDRVAHCPVHTGAWPTRTATGARHRGAPPRAATTPRFRIHATPRKQRARPAGRANRDRRSGAASSPARSGTVRSGVRLLRCEKNPTVHVRARDSVRRSDRGRHPLRPAVRSRPVSRPQTSLRPRRRRIPRPKAALLDTERGSSAAPATTSPADSFPPAVHGPLSDPQCKAAAASRLPAKPDLKNAT